MRILVLSNTPWDDNNSFGNSFSNIFGGMHNIEIGNIYLRSGNPNNSLDMQCFQITTGAVAKSIIKSKYKTGKKVNKTDSDAVLLNDTEQKAFDSARKKRWVLLLWMRELIWLIGKWKSEELLEFIDEFKPDIIFQPVYGQGYSYINRIALFIKKYTQKSMFGYVSDDCYTFRQFSLSPLYWIDRIARHGLLKKLMTSCEVLYVISDIQKMDYEQMLGIPCKVLTKGIKGTHEYQPSIVNSPIQFVYAGNIGENRWESLAAIGKALDAINHDGEKAYLNLYTTTPLTSRMTMALNCKSIHMCGSVPASQIPAIYKSSDILVHVEAMNLKYKLLVRQSFSTKLVDYFEIGKCIVAYGSNEVASISHLYKHDAAVVVSDPTQLKRELENIISNPELIREYGRKAWNCGCNYHQSSMFQAMLMNDFNKAIN